MRTPGRRRSSTWKCGWPGRMPAWSTARTCTRATIRGPSRRWRTRHRASTGRPSSMPRACRAKRRSWPGSPTRSAACRRWSPASRCRRGRTTCASTHSTRAQRCCPRPTPTCTSTSTARPCRAPRCSATAGSARSPPPAAHWATRWAGATPNSTSRPRPRRRSSRWCTTSWPRSATAWTSSTGWPRRRRKRPRPRPRPCA